MSSHPHLNNNSIPYLILSNLIYPSIIAVQVTTFLPGIISNKFLASPILSPLQYPSTIELQETHKTKSKLSVSLLASVLPTTLEDLLALGPGSAGGWYKYFFFNLTLSLSLYDSLFFLKPLYAQISRFIGSPWDWGPSTL